MKKRLLGKQSHYSLLPLFFVRDFPAAVVTAVPVKEDHTPLTKVCSKI